MQSTLFTELSVSEEANLSGGTLPVVVAPPPPPPGSVFNNGFVGVGGGGAGGGVIGGSNGNASGAGGTGNYIPVTITPPSRPTRGGHS
ncbi:hypothetical protein [Nostoc sp.]|uniref:hypothetical protein n=1 Tax=Nostoc sp. TaxID=1180 RepID=UPI002FFA8220